MNVAIAPVRDDDLKRRIVEFATDASTEITPRDSDLIPHLVTRLPAGTKVYIAHPPKASLEDVVRAALRVEASGLRASPHLVARRVTGARELREAAAELGDGGIDRALVVAGDVDRPAGPFSSSLDLLESGILTAAGFTSLGVAGHPEGHRAIGPSTLWRTLHEKQSFAERTGVKMHIVTQFGFDPAAIIAWQRHLGPQGITLPVRVGMAGPTSLQKLIGYAMACGVGASLRGILRNMHAIRNVAGLAATPEEMLVSLVQGGAVTPQGAIVHPHFYSFGGVVATARWLRAVVDGNFELQADGTFKVAA